MNRLLPCLLTAVSLCACLPLALNNRLFHPFRTMLFRTLGTLCALMIAALCANRQTNAGASVIFALSAFTLCDALQDANLLAGMACRMVGFIAIIIGTLRTSPVTQPMFVLLVIMMTICITLLQRWRVSFQGSGQMRIFCFYAIVLSAFCAVSVSSLSLDDPPSMISAAAGVLLAAANIMVCREMAGITPRYFHPLMLSIRFTGQLLLGWYCLV